MSKDDRLSIASSIWAALDNSIIDEEADTPEFFSVRSTGTTGEMRIIVTDEEGIVLRIYKATIERCEP